MDNIRAVINNLFRHINPRIILNKPGFFKNVDEDTFMDLGTSYIRQYSNDELRNMFRFMKSEFAWHNRKLMGDSPKVYDINSLNVFDTLSTFNYAVLIEENQEPKCQYCNLLRWHEMICSFEEDLFVSSFLAQNDLLKGKMRKFFFWKPVIGHNNYALNQMLGQGVAENHFHLKGSAPLFHISWILLMNDPDNIFFARHLKDYEKKKLYKVVENAPEYGYMSLITMWRMAATIRLFIFSYLTDDYVDIPDAYITIDELTGLCQMEEVVRILDIIRESSDKSIKFLLYESAVMRHVSRSTFIRIKRHIATKWLNKTIRDDSYLDDNIGIVCENIRRLGENHKGNNDEYLYDYTLGNSFITKNPNNSVNETICGERWLMYSMFRKVFLNDKKDEFICNLFYSYLVMKARIRSELIQTNQAIGFDNFFLYQSRKEDIIDDDRNAGSLSRIYLKMAVRDTLLNQPIRRLEARIAPKNTVESLDAAIKRYDDSICSGINDEEKKELKRRFFYVVHFIKEPDDECDDSFCVRNHFKREDIEKQAKCIAALRDNGYDSAVRIMGIDASSSEIGCRSEVFGQSFRYLKNHSPKRGLLDIDVRLPRLMATYHVGEDFLDIIDGIRAIDEAVHFLNLKCGDRLGHALALGLDPEEWYQSKSNRILISKQDYLDNLSWLLGKLRKYGIKDALDVQNYILKKISQLLEEIYIKNISASEYKNIVKAAQAFYKTKQINIGDECYGISFDYNDYYDACKLRGDNPELYREGFFKRGFANMDEWEAFAVNLEYPSNYQVRYNLSVSYLYYLYHYSEDVYKAGSEIIEVKVNHHLIDVIKRVQYHMQREISDMGICIETNPSSNYMIGAFRRFDKHPIVQWYNNGLTFDKSKLEECPQISVSINTDDQGVFATYIENEYAYLALALEKCVDDTGKKIYNRTMILQWLDNIRKMGLTQSFYQDCAEDE